MTAMIRYTLPSGAVILVPRDVCHAAATISFTMQDGRLVDAIIVRGER
jgi:hypothetical protein